MVQRFHFSKIILILLFFCSGCKNDKHEEEVNKREEELEFYYYPRKNVYYYPAKNYFLYSLDSSKSWSKFNNINSNEPNTLGEKIIIHTSNSDVYKDNENHRKLYNGTLYYISSKDSVRLSNGSEVIEQKKVIPKKKVAVVKKHEIKKSKSGIGKLIDKIFKKKK